MNRFLYPLPEDLLVHVLGYLRNEDEDMKNVASTCIDARDIVFARWTELKPPTWRSGLAQRLAELPYYSNRCDSIDVTNQVARVDDNDHVDDAPYRDLRLEPAHNDWDYRYYSDRFYWKVQLPDAPPRCVVRSLRVFVGAEAPAFIVTVSRGMYGSFELVKLDSGLAPLLVDAEGWLDLMRLLHHLPAGWICIGQPVHIKAYTNREHHHLFDEDDPLPFGRVELVYAAADAAKGEEEAAALALAQKWRCSSLLHCYNFGPDLIEKGVWRCKFSGNGVSDHIILVRRRCTQPPQTRHIQGLRMVFDGRELLRLHGAQVPRKLTVFDGRYEYIWIPLGLCVDLDRVCRAYIDVTVEQEDPEQQEELFFICVGECRLVQLKREPSCGMHIS